MSGPETVRPRKAAVSAGRAAAWSLLFALGISVVFTWPLPRHAWQAIPASHARPADPQAVRAMVPGDHLQLLYHFWLGTEMAMGRIPLFYNVYEMNEGDDADRREPGAYYAPFSLLFGLFSLPGSLALGWNLAGLFSLWLTALFTWRLAARYTACAWTAALAAVAATAFPYRWISLLGGSPTGFAMAWVPLLWLGIDDAVRRDRAAGGGWAGLALLLSSAGDAHTFFFAALSAPAWAAVALAADPRGLRGLRSGLVRKAGAALLTAAGLALGLLILRWTSQAIGETAVAGGRTWREVLIFSPSPRGFFTRRDLGVTSHVALGWIAPALAAAVLAAMAWRTRRSPRGLWLPCLLGVFALGLALLALGARGPFEGVAMRLARRLVPPYRVIRQSAKAFALFPTLLAVILAAGWGALFRRHAARAAVVALLLIVADYAGFMHPTLSRLPDRQSAYAAAAAEARARGRVPRAIVLPLWPGDSHYASAYQIYAILYRIRLLNVYRPMVPERYIEDVFLRLESLNQGMLTGEQADFLLDRGITHLLLHEDLFPEQVSPFPVGVTLGALRRHPRLEEIARDGPVRAFRILRGGPETEMPPMEGPAFPAWRWTAVREPFSETAELLSDGAGVPAAVRLADPGAWLRMRRPVRVAAFPDLRLWVRARGLGRLRLEAPPASGAGLADVDSADWAWYSLPLPTVEPHGILQPVLSAPVGSVDVKAMWLGLGPVPGLEPGEEAVWPASAFFRSGYTGDDGRSVTLRRDWDAAWPVFYGPHLPLPAGQYEIRWQAEADGDAPARFRVRSGDQESLPWTPLPIGSDRAARFAHPSDVPLFIELEFARRTDLTLREIRLRRLPDG